MGVCRGVYCNPVPRAEECSRWSSWDVGFLGLANGLTKEVTDSDGVGIGLEGSEEGEL